MDIDRLDSRQSKKLFFILVLVALIALFCIRHIAWPLLEGKEMALKPAIEEILDTLFATIVVTVGLALFFVWLAPRKAREAKMEVLLPHDINKYHLQSRADTKEWWYNGGSGRYTRDVTLPYLAESCKSENRTINVRIQILDPNNEDLCQIYADYRNNLSSVHTHITTSEVRCDLLATIFAACFWKMKQPLLNIEIYLKNHFSLFRTEFSDNMVLVTREDPRDPGIVYQRGTFFYQAYYNDLVQGSKQDTIVSMQRGSCPSIRAETPNKINKETIRQVIASLNISFTITDEELDRIHYFIQNKTTPYRKASNV